MMKGLLHISAIISLIVFLGSCEIKDNDTEPSESFFRIYDNNQFDASFVPVDVIQTSRGGYLILSGRRLEDSDFLGVNIIHTDENGEFMEQDFLPPSIVHPVADWLAIDSTYYFFCMDADNLQAQLYGVDASGNLSDPIGINLTMPLYASLDGEEFIVTSYDNESRTTVLSTVSRDGQVNASASFSIGDGEGVEEPIIDHYTRTGRQFPFSNGRLDDGTYYFNGFYNFTFSVVFTDLSSDPTGVVQGQQDDGGISSLLPLTGSQFAATRFNFGDNYLIPNATLNLTGISSAGDLGGDPILEWVNDAIAYIEEVEIDAQPVLIFVSTTKNGQLMLRLHSKDDGSWLGTDYLGFANPFEVRALHKTVDGGLTILSQTSVAGRFPRASLFKLSPKELEKMITVK